MTDHEHIFTLTYKHRIWGNNQNFHYDGSSGFGSTIDFVKPVYMPFIKNFIFGNDIKSIVDLGCGDFVFGNELFKDIKNIKYTGYDVYKDLIDYNNALYKNINKYKFIHLDILKDKNQIIDGELFIIKDVLQHWSNDEITIFLNYILKNKKYKYILITNSFAEKEFEDVKQEVGVFRPLSAKFSPLKQFKPIVLLIWGRSDMTFKYKDQWYPYFLETSLIINNI